MERAPQSAPPGLPVTLVGALRRPATYSGAIWELYSVLQCVARYPGGVISEPSRRPRSGHYWPGFAHDTPVLLVHGYGHNRSGWWVMRRHLHDAGFSRIDTFNYHPFVQDVPGAARRLAARVETLRRTHGTDRVHVVAHSLGGILLRWMIQELDGEAVVDTAVTLGTPHEGTLAAWLAPGRTAAQLRPGSWVMKRLEGSARPTAVRWVAFYSNVDELVQPSRSAMLRNPALGALNLLAKDHGHMSLMVSPRVARAVVDQLEVSERVAGVAPVSNLPTGAPAPAVSAGPEAQPASSGTLGRTGSSR